MHHDGSRKGGKAAGLFINFSKYELCFLNLYDWYKVLRARPYNSARSDCETFGKLAYWKLSTTMDLPTSKAQKRKPKTQQSRRTKRKLKPRRKPPTFGQCNTQDGYVQTWIPKDTIS